MTTGRAILFTGTTLTASVIFWLFFPMRFQAEMALLLALILFLHVVGALVFIPSMVSLFKPRFATAGTAAATTCESVATAAVPLTPGERARLLPNGQAAAPQVAPAAVKAIIGAGNQIVGKPSVSENTSLGSEPPKFGRTAGAFPVVLRIDSAAQLTQGLSKSVREAAKL